MFLSDGGGGPIYIAPEFGEIEKTYLGGRYTYKNQNKNSVAVKNKNMKLIQKNKKAEGDDQAPLGFGGENRLGSNRDKFLVCFRATVIHTLDG